MFWGFCFRWLPRYFSLHVGSVVVVLVVVVVAQQWDVARPQDVLSPTRGMARAQACVIKLRVLADQPGIPIAGNVIRGTQSPHQGGYGDGVKHAMSGKESWQDHCSRMTPAGGYGTAVPLLRHVVVQEQLLSS